MEKTLLIKSIFIFLSMWGLTVALLWFRPRIELFWKFITTIIFVFYVWFFFEEFVTGYDSFISAWYPAIINFLKELIAIIFVNLFFLWPVALIIIFYKADELGAEKLLKFMCILTLILWIVFVVYIYYSTGIDEFLYKRLKEMVPYSK